MKSNLKTNYEHWDQLGLRHKHEDGFYTKGKVGTFKEEMSASISFH